MSIHPTESGATPKAPLATQPLMTVTPAAVAKVRQFAEGNEEFQGKAFRVFVEGGGCSGFRYAFVFDDRGADDQAWNLEGVDVVVDPISLQYLRGATVDYVEDLRGAGFVVQNPNAQTSCGCGSSFSV